MVRSEIASDLSLVDDTAWEFRSKFWTEQNPSTKHSQTLSLILSGHAVSLRIEGGTLAIKNGFTHYPQKHETYRYFKGDLDLPKRIILLDCSGSISFDVLSWLAEQGVDLIHIGWRGEIICAISNSGYSANSYRVLWQLETHKNPGRQLEFSNAIITRKIESSISTLEKSIRQNAAWNKAIEAAYLALTKLDERQPKTISEVRGIEANAAAAYFRAWRGIPLKWKRVGRKPIPENWKAFEQRTSPFLISGNRHAGHPVNAILNYAYTVLQSQIQIQAVAEGFDPLIGIMHEPRHASTPFIYDLMEPERPKIDRVVLEFIKEQTFHPADFIIQTDGVCRLHPELARCIANKVLILVGAHRLSKWVATTL